MNEAVEHVLKLVRVAFRGSSINSSPPRRAASQTTNRPGNVFGEGAQNVSPAGWPWLSLICLKPSRSRKKARRGSLALAAIEFRLPREVRKAARR